MLPIRPRSSTAANPGERAKLRIWDKSHLGQPSVENAIGIVDVAVPRAKAAAAAAGDIPIRNSRRVGCMLFPQSWESTCPIVEIAAVNFLFDRPILMSLVTGESNQF